MWGRFVAVSAGVEMKGGSLDDHMSMLSWHPHAQNAHGSVRSPHGLFRLQEAALEWLWGGKAHGVIYLNRWRDLCTVVVHFRPRRTQSIARISLLGSGGPMHTLGAGGLSGRWEILRLFWPVHRLAHFP